MVPGAATRGDALHGESRAPRANAVAQFFCFDFEFCAGDLCEFEALGLRPVAVAVGVVDGSDHHAVVLDVADDVVDSELAANQVPWGAGDGGLPRAQII